MIHFGDKAKLFDIDGNSVGVRGEQGTQGVEGFPHIDRALINQRHCAHRSSDVRPTHQVDFTSLANAAGRKQKPAE